MINIIQLIRLKDWTKNLIVILPILFSKNLYDYEKFLDIVILFIIFCFASSIIYIFNDIVDRHEDKKNSLKIKIKPIARGSLSVNFSYLVIFFFLIILFVFLFFYQLVLFHISIFFIINFFYNFYFKKLPFLDLLVISLGYIIRLDAGSHMIDIQTSSLMIITIFSLSFFVISMKRYIELTNDIFKKSIKLYNKLALKLLIIFSLSSSIIFYSLFIYFKYNELLITLPLAFYFLLRYYFSYKDKKILSPFDIIFRDYKLCICILLYFTFVIIIMY